MDDFFEFYDLEKKVVFSEAPREEDPKNGGERRVCRFCKQIEAPFGATFEKKAHTISKALGNKHLLSSDECDECNTRFSRYENEFTRYIELRRALYDGLKRFTTREGRFTAESSKQINGATKISDKTPDLLHTKTLDNGDVLISAPTNSYIPIMVYRSLLKFALAITDRKYLDDYEDTFKALIDDNLHNNLCATAKICRDTVNIQVKGHCCIFKRKDTKQRVPNHIVVFGYKDLILQFFCHIVDRISICIDILLRLSCFLQIFIRKNQVQAG